MFVDTVYAVATPAGCSARAALRISGPRALAAAAAVFEPTLARVRAQQEGAIVLPQGRVPALALVMPGSASFTGEDTVELHVPGSPALCDAILRRLGAALGEEGRPARPGEFTARAYQNGRLDAAQAQGVLMLIHADGARAAAAGASWLLGGLSDSVEALRRRLLDALALLEAGLDFEPADTGSVATADWLPQLQRAQEGVAALIGEMPSTTPGGETLLLGRSNAGKSTLANALAGADAALVDGTAGTTRDLLRIDAGDGVVLWDAPGDLDDPSAIDRAALALRDRLGAQAGACLLVVDPRHPPRALPAELAVAAVVYTKQDLPDAIAAADTERSAGLLQRLSLPAELPRFAVAAPLGLGIEELRSFLRHRRPAGFVDAGAPLRAALDRCAAGLGAALAAAQAGMGPELCALDVQQALAALDEISGSHGPEDVLDRIYGSFCLGK